MHSIKQKLIVNMLLISIVPIFIIGTITYGISSVTIKAQAEQSLTNMTGQV